MLLGINVADYCERRGRGVRDITLTPTSINGRSAEPPGPAAPPPLAPNTLISQGEIGTQWIRDLCNAIVKEGCIPEDWKSVWYYQFTKERGIQWSVDPSFAVVHARASERAGWSGSDCCVVWHNGMAAPPTHHISPILIKTSKCLAAPRPAKRRRPRCPATFSRYQSRHRRWK